MRHETWLSWQDPLKKILGETVHFNSHSSDKRGLAVLIKDGTPIEEIHFENIIKGNFSKLSFKVKNEHVLVKCIYAPNINMNSTGPDNESKAFFKEVFDDWHEDKYTHKVTVGDFNVALSHTNDHQDIYMLIIQILENI